MKREIVLIDRKGKEAFRLPNLETPAVLIHDKRKWGFVNATLNGDISYFELPATPPMGNPQEVWA